MNKNKPKIYWLSDSPFTVTGYATISTNILNGLSKKGWDCYYQAHNYVGQTMPPGATLEGGKKLNFTIFGTGRAPYSKDLLVPRIRELKPDYFGILLDTFMTFPWILNLDFAPAKTIFYFPSDGEGRLPLSCENVLKKFHMPIGMSKFAQQQAQKFHNLKTYYIPHAVDTKNYYPLKNKEAIKKKFGLQEKFVVGSVYRNQGRKMADRMFMAFAKFAKKHEDAVLFCHSDPYDQSAVFNSMALIKRLGIENRVVWSGMSFYKGFSYEQMNEVYNAMDVFFLSTSGEGFGVPTIEASACEVPVAITDYTTTKELVMDNGQTGIPIPITTKLVGNWNVDRGVMDINKAVDALDKLYESSELRKKLGETGRKKVLKYYDWDVVINDWNKLLMGGLKNV